MNMGLFAMGSFSNTKEAQKKSLHTLGTLRDTCKDHLLGHRHPPVCPVQVLGSQTSSCLCLCRWRGHRHHSICAHAGVGVTDIILSVPVQVLGSQTSSCLSCAGDEVTDMCFRTQLFFTCMLGMWCLLAWKASSRLHCLQNLYKNTVIPQGPIFYFQTPES